MLNSDEFVFLFSFYAFHWGVVHFDVSLSFTIRLGFALYAVADFDYVLDSFAILCGAF